MNNKPIAVLGEGAWGTAIATVLAHNKYKVHVWCHDETVAHQISTFKENKRYLPGVSLQTTIISKISIADAIKDAEYIFVSTPVPFVRTVLQHALDMAHPDAIWIFLNKGIEEKTGFLPTQILQDIAAKKGQRPRCAVVSGPSFAFEVAHEELTGLIVACASEKVAKQVIQLLENTYITAEYSTDIIGVQASGALKNGAALIMGMFEGMKASDNTKALAFVRCYHELIMLGSALGGQPETFFDLAGLGDLVLTAYGNQGRNRLFGKALGAGTTVSALKAQYSLLPEGVATLQALPGLLAHYDLELPLFETAIEILAGNTQPTDLFECL